MAWIHDLRYAARSLFAKPVLLVITTVALSIGIAANAIMFGIVDQLLLRPPSYVQAPDGLRRIYFHNVSGGDEYTSPVTTYRAYLALRDRVPAFADVALSTFPTAYTLGRGAGAQSVQVQPVSGNYFTMLGVRPARGRAFADGEDVPPQGALVAVVSDGFWKLHLGEADPLGKRIVLDGQTFTVVGVAPPGFSGLDRRQVDVWVPISAIALQKSGDTWHSEPNNWWIETFARLRPGVAPEGAAAQATTAYRAEAATWGNRAAVTDTPPDVLLGSIIGTRAPSGWTPESKVSLWLMGVSVIVLLIACANVANLLIARTLQRRREIGVRLALGISRGRLVRMLLTEAGLLATIGALVALGIAFAGSHLVQHLLLPGIVWSDSVLDARVLTFTLAATIVCILLAGLAPALQSVGLGVSESLKSSAQQVAGSRGRLRVALLVFQAALSMVLLVGAGLFLRSLRNVTSRDVGIDLDRVVLVTMNLEDAGFVKPDMENVFAQGAERVSAIPGVQQVSVVRGVIPARSASGISVRVPGKERIRFERGGPYYAVVDAAFFGTMGTSFVRGRNFTPAEERVKNRTMIVNRLLADAYWPGADPVGQCVRLGSDTTCSEVVGVVENMMTFRVVKDDRALVYLPPGHASFGNKLPRALLVRSASDPAALEPLIRGQLQGLSANMPFVRIEPFTRIVAPQLRPWRLGATMFTVFGLIALVIAAVGLYSVMAYWVAQRRHEIGVRMALGATGADVVRLIAAQSSRAIGLGLVAGGAVAIFASRWVVDLLYETSPRDPAVYATAALVLVAAAIAATIIPARRSARVDPAQAIRVE